MTQQFQSVAQELEKIRQRRARLWDDLDEDQKVAAFCAVCERLWQSVAQDRGSVQHVLHQVFGFSDSAYTFAHNAKFPAIHQALWMVSQADPDRAGVDVDAPATDQPAPETPHRDKLGVPLAVGDYVAWPYRNSLRFGRIETMHPKKVTVADVGVNWVMERLHYPENLMKVDGSSVTWWMIKNSQTT